MIKGSLGLAAAIERQNAVSSPSQPGTISIDRVICWYCLEEKGLHVRVNSFAAQEGRFVVIVEGKDEKAQQVAYGVCSPHAEKLGMVYRARTNSKHP